jgi:micrococcal nuclease
VRIEQNPTQDTRDQYGRLQAYVWVEDGAFLNQQIITDGYAHKYTYRTPIDTILCSRRWDLWSPEMCNSDSMTKTHDRSAYLRLQ